LQVTREEKRKAPQVLLDGIQFHLDTGDALGVLADSGAGKTLLLQALTGHLDSSCTVNAGQILLADKPVTGASWQSREMVYLPADVQDFLPPFLSVEDFAAELVRAHYPDLGKTEAKERLRQRSLLLDFAPWERYQLPPAELAHFERIGMVIAVATLLDPQILALDCTLENLEWQEKEVLLEMLRNLMDAGVVKSVVLSVRRDVESLRKFCSHVVVLYAGQIMEAGRCSLLLHAPAHPYTQAILAFPEREKRASVQDASPTGGCKYANECPMFQPDCIQGKIQFRTIYDHDVRCLLSPQA
jgi:ABC-type dipeptide/oligopeptide/nickel transport system ATPase component